MTRIICSVGNCGMTAEKMFKKKPYCFKCYEEIKALKCK